MVLNLEKCSFILLGVDDELLTPQRVELKTLNTVIKKKYQVLLLTTNSTSQRT